MELKKPQNIDKMIWTKHVIEKMRFYNLSENRLKRVLRNPKRKEKGVAPGTLAVMQPTGSKKHPTEIWLMYQRVKTKFQNSKSKPMEKIKVISAWRYPGVSPIGKEIPIPEDILRELYNII